MKRIPVVEVCCSLLILLYAYTAISKFLRFKQFRFVLDESPLIHTGAGVIAWLVPLIELLIVLLLINPNSRRTGLKISLTTLLLFTNYLFYILLFASHLPCSCGGVISSLSWQQHILFNTACIAVNIAGILSSRYSLNKEVA